MIALYDSFLVLFLSYIVDSTYTFTSQIPGGIHDLRMDGGLAPGFQKATLF